MLMLWSDATGLQPGHWAATGPARNILPDPGAPRAEGRRDAAAVTGDGKNRAPPPSLLTPPDACFLFFLGQTGFLPRVLRRGPQAKPEVATVYVQSPLQNLKKQIEQTRAAFESSGSCFS